ncbi:MAG TPA: hypothetical protein VK446_12260 [Methylocystis sp.]|nr:hypothetical protein [Methylocystis sp.]
MISRGIGSLLLSSLCALAAGAAQAQPGPPPQGLADGRFDGVWEFQSTTAVGACPGIAPGDVTIRGGHVVAANGGGAEPWGYVESDGTIVAKFAVGGHVSRANGSLRGESGSGAWSSSTDFCGGNWRAQRRSRAAR